MLRQTERDNSAAGSNIQNLRFRVSDFRFQKLNQLLGLRSRHERTFIAQKCLAAELDRAEQMLERFGLRATLHQIAQRNELRFGKFSFELQIEIHARQPERMRQQMLRVQTRALELVLLKISGRRLQHFEQRPWFRHAIDDSFKRSAMSAAWSVLIISSR